MKRFDDDEFLRKSSIKGDSQGEPKDLHLDQSPPSENKEEKRRRILDYLFERGRSATQSTIAQFTGLPETVVEEYLGHLFGHGKIEEKLIQLRSFEHGTKFYVGNKLTSDVFAELETVRQEFEAEFMINAERDEDGD